MSVEELMSVDVDELEASGATPETAPGQEPQERWRDLPWRARLDHRRITGTAPFFPLAVLFALNAVDELDRTAFVVLSPEIRRWFGLDIEGLFTITAAITAVNLLLELPIGYLSDRKNRVRMALAGAALWTVFTVLTGFAGFVSSLALLYVARAGSALAKNLGATHRSLLSDYYPVESRARVFYFHNFANSVGQIAGPLVAGGLATVLAWQYPFFILAAPTLLAIFFALRLKEPVRGIQERRAAGADEETAGIEEKPAGFAETFRVIASGRSTKRIWLSLPFLTAALAGLQTLLNNFYAEVYHIGPGLRGLIGAFGEVAQVGGLIVGAVFVQRALSRDPGRVMRVIALIAIGACVCIAGVALSPNVAVAIVFQVGNSVLQVMLLPGLLAVFSLIIPPRMRALGFATGSIFVLLGALILPFIGAVSDHFGFRTGLLVFIPLYLVGAFILSSTAPFIGIDAARIRASALAQAEMRRRRLEGDAQMLIIRGLDAGYDQTQILFGVDFEVSDGEIIALLGTNGAGKSTLLKAISGLVQPMSGVIVFDGEDITASDAIHTAHLGIAQVPGGRGIFPSLTVAENLRAAGWMYRKDKAYVEEATRRVLDIFPILGRRWDTRAGNLSGGEQQMLSLSQAFIAKPRLLMIDELSLGLAPTIVDQLLDVVRAIHEQGTTIILVEQSVNVALRIAERAVFMEKGEIRFFGPTSKLLERPDILRSVFLQGAHSGLELGRASANGNGHGDGNGDGNGNGSSRARRPLAVRRAERLRRQSLADGPVVLEAVGLTKRYGGVTAVNGVGFALHEHEVLGLIGPNGAGKTTIFDLLSGFTPLDGGRVLLGGVDVTGWPPHRRAAAGLGRSFQDARLWPSLTVQETLAASLAKRVEMTGPLAAAFALPSVDDSERAVAAKVDELIGLLGLGAFRDKFIAELSTGSRRMVEIATLIANEPAVLLLDEPSSGIAQKEAEALGPMLKEVQRYTGCAILVIEHDMPLLAGLADRVVGLELGGVIATGTPDEVLNHPQVIESYLGTASYADLGIDVTATRPRSNGSPN
jgi:ABC-type branched-subunit amino acid transport system ATPase component/sugar phosphate permease